MLDKPVSSLEEKTAELSNFIRREIKRNPEIRNKIRTIEQRIFSHTPSLHPHKLDHNKKID